MYNHKVKESQKVYDFKLFINGWLVGCFCDTGQSSLRGKMHTAVLVHVNIKITCMTTSHIIAWPLAQITAGRIYP